MKATRRFFRHRGICRPMCSCFKSLDRSTAFRTGSAQTVKDAPEVLRPTHRRDEFRPAIPQRVARQHCPPPLHRQAHPKSVPGSGTMNLQRTVNSVLTVCLSPGDHPRCRSSHLPQSSVPSLATPGGCGSGSMVSQRRAKRVHANGMRPPSAASTRAPGGTADPDRARTELAC